MALDFDALKAAVDHFHEAGALTQANCTEASRQATSQLREALPLLNEVDLAAVAFYIASMLSGIRNLHVVDAGDVLTDSAVGYTLGAAKWLGMMPEVTS